MTPQDLAAWDRPGPRYTSYPTVPLWKPIERSDIAQALSGLSEQAQVYVHLPFCAEQCSFCGCTQVVAGRQSAGDKYLDALQAQVENLELPAQRVPVQRIHLGGGTPTWMDLPQLERLHSILMSRFDPQPGAELSVEGDPQITTIEQLELLTEQGYRRLSLGVQSFHDQVLQAVHRPQLVDRVPLLLEKARALGWTGLNLDLMYGLPYQQPEVLRRDLEHAVDLQPDRVAVFGYAHVPWIRRHQRRINEATLPGTLARAESALIAQEVFTEAGYVAIGMDHFAKADDALAIAQAKGELTRNFMGYMPGPQADMIGLGVSSISQVQGTFWQQSSRLAPWQREALGGSLEPERGWVSSGEDLLREWCIAELMCHMRLDADRLRERFSVEFKDHFADAVDGLQDLVHAGLVQVDARGVQVKEEGRPLLRLAAAPFDAWRGGGARYSRAV